MISSVFGLRFDNHDLVLDPVISPRLGKVAIEYEIEGKLVKLLISPQQGSHTPKTIKLNGQDVPFELMPNRYRSGAALVCRSG
ncbi:hypothetical protein [Vibrio taketomensis]|uniref:hypothetical protein n=1 Tax=Vibrio taketomensis TaxID=2572923 RepID=UPI001E5D6FB5|nr:hypothetical protein [Vibrio taketomensis]